eukprot:TRINITY_DN4550_c0_g1_i4.p1 TRINITY_DN4550_c0_g1~~TRINITY_DN4550_c0_g1_i4.p1  ORF type:complete len:382 (-),score=73.80 TRINITY_DN4550_c0_g1_i4:782-1927(-)
MHLVSSWRLFSRFNFFKGKVDRGIQEDLDALEVYWTTSFYKNLKERRRVDPFFSSTSLNTEQVQELSNFHYSHTIRRSELYSTVRENLDDQVSEMMDYIVKIGGLNPYPEPVFKDEGDGLLESYIKRKINLENVEFFSPGTPIYHPSGFQLQIKKSDITHPASGYGVWVCDGVIWPGTVIAIYPGVVYSPEGLTESLIKDNDYMISRYDNMVIDGRSWEKRSKALQQRLIQLSYATGHKLDTTATTGATTTTADATTESPAEYNSNIKKYRNPFGIANYMNHPPPGVKPNVLAYAYDFPNTLSPQAIPFIPNIYGNELSPFLYTSSCVMRSVVVLAKQKISNQELYLNYRYNPSNPYPDWYVQPDVEEAKRRWAKRTLFGR